MKTSFKWIFGWVFFLSLPFFSMGQEDSTQWVRIVMDGGKEWEGIILEDDGREILLHTSNVGKVYLVKDQIDSVIEIKSKNRKVVDGVFPDRGPLATRYFQTSNALPLDRNSHYMLVHLYGPEVQFVLSDRFSVGLITTWLASPMILSMRYTIPTRNPRINFGFGTLVASSMIFNDFRGYGGYHLGMVTLGDELRNLTISAGYAYGTPGALEVVSVPGVYPDPASVQREEVNERFIQAPIVSVAGSLKLKGNIRFMFNSTFSYSFTEEVNRVRQNNLPANLTILDDPLMVRTFGFHVLPAIRFQYRLNQAFQLAVGGAVWFREEEINTLPTPMASWFIEF
jgi:hypothetical protein